MKKGENDELVDEKIESVLPGNQNTSVLINDNNSTNLNETEETLP